MRELPDFSLAHYTELLACLRSAGYRFAPVREMPAWDGDPTLYLRHDVDFHVLGAERMAHADAEAGVRSTFYVLVAGHYNIFLRENAEILASIAALGHEVGLHYDLRTYPEDPDAALELLEFQTGCIERVTGAPVTSITMHEPSAGHVDALSEMDRYINPHAARFVDVAYISDSCRAWRDERLLSCTRGEGPERLVLNLHPDLWLDASVTDRVEYLRVVSARYAAHHADAYFAEYMTPIWRTHEAVRLHEERTEGSERDADRE